MIDDRLGGFWQGQTLNIRHFGSSGRGIIVLAVVAGNRNSSALPFSG
jgi:hypothetical protein